MAQSPEYPDLLWIPPKSFTRGRHTGQPTKICVHDTEGSEHARSAEDGASYDQRRTDGTSAHYYVDADSVVQCIRTTDRSHTALYHGNNEAIHYELCGRAAQTRVQWLDATSRPTIRNAARQIARDMRKYGIPLRRLSGRQVRDSSAKGICGHVDFTVGWPEDGGSHTDPGPSFPWDVLFADISEFLKEDDMYSDEDRRRDVNTNGRVAEVYPIKSTVNALAGKVDALLAAAGEEVQRDADVRAELAELRDQVAAIQAGDPEALAKVLGDRLTADFIETLNSVRLTVEPDAAPQ